MFSGDTNLIVNGKDLTDLQAILKFELPEISIWLTINNL